MTYYQFLSLICLGLWINSGHRNMDDWLDVIYVSAIFISFIYCVTKAFRVFFYLVKPGIYLFSHPVP